MPAAAAAILIGIAAVSLLRLLAGGTSFSGLLAALIVLGATVLRLLLTLRLGLLPRL